MFPPTPTKLSELDAMTNMEKRIRMHIRNAWMAESSTDVRKAAMERFAQGKRFEAVALLELACDIYEEG